MLISIRIQLGIIEKNRAKVVIFCRSNESSVVLLGHSGPVQDTAFLNGSQLLVSVSMDKTMRAWNLNQYSCSAIYR